MIIENIKSFRDFLFFLDFFRGHQKKSRIFLGFSSMKNMGKHKEMTGEPYENLIKFLVASKKSRKNQKSQKLYIFSIIIIPHEEILQFSSPNSKR